MDNTTHQVSNTDLEARSPKWLGIGAQLISIILHPLFIPTYIFLFLMQVVPFEFAGITSWQLTLRLFSCFWYTAFFPAIAIFLLWRLQFIQSILLKTQKERIVPFIIVMFFYWWMYYLSRNFIDQPIVLRFFYMGIFLSTVVGLILNNYFKISLHGMGAGGGVAALVLFSWYYALPMWPYISIAIMLAGLIATARIIISDHTNREIYIGIIMGMLCQVLSYIFLA